MAWIFRSRAPLPVLLHLAAHEGRLLDEPDGCVLLEAPSEGSPRHGVPLRRGAAIARFLDTFWDPLVFGVPLLVAMLAAVPVARLAGPTAGLAVVVGALVYVVAVLAVVVVRQVVVLTAGRRRLVGTAVGQLRRFQWTVVLLHVPSRAGAATAAALVDRARRHVSADRSPLLILTGGITGAVPAPHGPGGLHAEPLSPHHPVLVARRRTDLPLRAPAAEGRFGGRDLAVVLGGTAGLVLLLADGVATEEARICQNTCEGQPARYGDALYWLVSRMLGGDPDGLGATSAGNRFVGLMLTVYGVFVLVAIIGRVVQQRVDEDLRSGGEVAAAFEQAFERTRPPRAGRPRPARTRRAARWPVAGRVRRIPPA